MKKILCYGDSNTFGFIPKNGKRYSQNERWSGILKNSLKNKFLIFEEGLNNRKGFVEFQDEIKFNTKLHLPTILDNFDILILAIGTNDLQANFKIDLFKLEKEINNFFNFLKNKNLETIIISPVLLDDTILKGNFNALFNKESILKSEKMNEIYENYSKKYNFHYFNFNNTIKPSEIDGLHYEKESHEIISKTLYNFIIENF